MSKPKLKPCPFCGGDAIEYFHNGKDYCTAHILCKVCGASTKPYVGTKEYVVRSTRFEWNRRVKTDAKCVSCDGGYCEDECGIKMNEVEE